MLPESGTDWRRGRRFTGGQLEVYLSYYFACQFVLFPIWLFEARIDGSWRTAMLRLLNGKKRQFDRGVLTEERNSDAERAALSHDLVDGAAEF